MPSRRKNKTIGGRTRAQGARQCRQGSMKLHARTWQGRTQKKNKTRRKRLEQTQKKNKTRRKRLELWWQRRWPRKMSLRCPEQVMQACAHARALSLPSPLSHSRSACMNLYTYVFTAHTHARTHTHTHTGVHIYVHKYQQTYTYISAHIHTCAHTDGQGVAGGGKIAADAGQAAAADARVHLRNSCGPQEARAGCAAAVAPAAHVAADRPVATRVDLRSADGGACGRRPRDSMCAKTSDAEVGSSAGGVGRGQEGVVEGEVQVEVLEHVSRQDSRPFETAGRQSSPAPAGGVGAAASMTGAVKQVVVPRQLGPLPG